jgi:hypothetical protein
MIKFPEFSKEFTKSLENALMFRHHESKLIETKRKALISGIKIEYPHFLLSH